MKKLLVIPLLFLLVTTACEKDPIARPSPTTPIQPPTQPPPTPPGSPSTPPNTAPNVFAGADIYIVFPDNICTLKGSAQYPQNIENILWNKITGPGSFIIETQGLYETKVRNLEKGIYSFELTVTDKAGLSGKDTVSVNVLEQGSGKNQKIFNDLEWGCPMSCHLRIENFHSFVPTDTAFKAYMKRDNSTEWVEIINMSLGTGKYVWTIYNNGLEILEDGTDLDPSDSPDVKITF